MNQRDATRMLCQLVTKVGEEIYRSEIPHDCICDEAPQTAEQVHPEIIAFINNAVNEKIRDVQFKRSQRDTEVTINADGAVKAIYKNPGCTINHPGSSCNVACGY